MAEQEKKDKHSYFQKISGRRLEHILEALNALGNCSTPTSYAYTNQELPPMFEAITKKLIEVRQRLVTHSPYAGIPFRLQPSDKVELDGHVINRQQLAAMSEVMELIETASANFTSLELVREQYETQFGDGLSWNCPVFHDGYSGCILLPVQEGILYLPYKEVSSETYEQFDLQGIGLMTKWQAQTLSTALWDSYIQLLGLLSDIQAFSLAQGDPTGEDSYE